MYFRRNYRHILRATRRDPLLSAKDQREKILRLERMVAGGYPEESGAGDSPDGGSQSKAKESSEGADDNGGEEPTAIKCACRSMEP